MVRKRDEAVESLDRALKRRTAVGAEALWDRLEGGKVRCYSCGHRCVILDGLDGICRVRYNRGGKLYVPRGYVAGLQVDPIEKKPFFHAFPGADALSFGMLGCDYHCSYCFAPGTRVLTREGHLRIEEIFARGARGAADGEAFAGPSGMKVVTHTGKSRPVPRAFRHSYRGRLVRVRPACLPAIDLTPEHPVLMARRDRGRVSTSFVPAGDLRPGDWLVVPRSHEFSSAVVLRSRDLLSNTTGVFTARRKIRKPVLERILAMSRSGRTSREIGQVLDLDASHVRHLRSKVARGVWNLERLDEKPARLIEDRGSVRISNEHAPGIPAEIPLDESFARLLGIYCAEGSVSRSRTRRHAATLVFSLGRHEKQLVADVARLVNDTLFLRCRRVERSTTRCLEVGKASAGLLFERLCGTGARNKRVPEALFRAHRPVVEAFVSGYVDGDGHVARDGTITVSSVSAELAAGVAGLLLRLGILPQWYEYDQPQDRRIQGRAVRQSPTVHVLRWHPGRRKASNVLEAGEHYLVPVRTVETREYEGPVYNLEVAGEHTYLANGVAVHNCQNWLTSQALRDDAALSPPREVSAAEIVTLAKRYGVPAMVSTYNEPLITSEWAVEVFTLAKAEGIACGYVSNGNGTPEVLDYIRPWVDLYKVDLKGFRDASYRQLGGKLQNVLDTITHLHAKGFWVEIVTLLVPGFNDSREELRELTSFVASVSPDIPWHVTAFHQDYKMTDPQNTTVRDLTRAAEIGKEAGLRFVYAGNLPGRVGNLENTYCPGCGEVLVERSGYHVRSYHVTGQGTCPRCGAAVPGYWSAGRGAAGRDAGSRARGPRAVHVPASPLFEPPRHGIDLPPEGSGDD